MAVALARRGGSGLWVRPLPHRAPYLRLGHAVVCPWRHLWGAARLVGRSWREPEPLHSPQASSNPPVVLSLSPLGTVHGRRLPLPGAIQRATLPFGSATSIALDAILRPRDEHARHRRGVPLPPLFHGCGFHSTAAAWKLNRDAYEVLGVSKSATDKDVKLAYYKLAKKFHPDMNPGDPSARKKFQEVSEAFELLRDSEKRAKYDREKSSSWWQGAGTQGAGNSQHQQQHQYTYTQQQANDTWESVKSDQDIIREAFNEYLANLNEDLNEALDDMNEGKFQKIWDFVSTYRSAIMVVAVPAVVVLVAIRYPPAVMAIVRGAVALSSRALYASIFFSNRQSRALIFNYLWAFMSSVSSVAARRSEEYLLQSAARRRARARRARGGGSGGSRRGGGTGGPRGSSRGGTGPRSGRRSRHM